MQSETRPAAVAGRFYPGDPKSLRSAVTAYFDSARSTEQDRASAIIAPHAGYIYSGPTAAQAFAVLRGLRGEIRRTVVIGPSHFVAFEGIAAPSCRAFATPLGAVSVDTNAIQALAADGLIVIDDRPHDPEHALEVELPFLQFVLGDVPIIPLLTGMAGAEAVAAVLDRLWDETTLIVVSSDLSHYHDYETAKRLDARTADAIEQLDPSAIGPDDACGAVAVRGLLLTAHKRGLTVNRLDLRNSGDTAGDRHRVVGYGAWSVTASTGGRVN